MFWKIFLDMCIFSYYLLFIIKKKSKIAMHNLHHRVQSRGATHQSPPSPIERGSGSYKMLFLVEPVTLIRNTWNLVSV